MPSRLLVTGSLAYDRIAVFRDKFSNHILKGHVHNLNVSFLVEDMEVNYGGTGGNIAYTLAQLDEKPVLMAAAGSDSDDYMRHLKKAKVDLGEIQKFPNILTASATIMTDLDDNQITSFYMGSMAKSHQLKIAKIKAEIDMVVIAPNEKKAMIAYGDYCFKKEIPFIADPGQGIPAFSPIELQEFLMGAHLVICNDYEWEMIQEKTGWGLKEILNAANYLIVTYGDKGSRIWCIDGTIIEVPPYKAKKVVDPTGSGDAYRAGLMYGYAHDFDIEQSANIGSWLASKVVEKKGTQNHKIPKKEFQDFLKSL
jgi:adenosine kinase